MRKVEQHMTLLSPCRVLSRSSPEQPADKRFVVILVDLWLGFEPQAKPVTLCAPAQNGLPANRQPVFDIRELVLIQRPTVNLWRQFDSRWPGTFFLFFEHNRWNSLTDQVVVGSFCADWERWLYVLGSQVQMCEKYIRIEVPRLVCIERDLLQPTCRAGRWTSCLIDGTGTREVDILGPTV